MRTANGILINLVMVGGLLVTSAAARAQTTWHVDDDAPLGGDGLSWDAPYRYLQDALAAAGDGDEIRVAGGTYKPDRDEGGNVTPGERSETFQLITGVALMGGYAGLADPEAPDFRDPAANETILSGDLLGDDGPDFAANDENSYHVTTGSGTDATATLDGFTITAGNADGEEPDYRGAGMYNFYGDPSVANCAFVASVAAFGGGMNNRYGNPGVVDCTFTNNVATNTGGGMYNYENSSPSLSNCSFLDNRAPRAGGLYNQTGSTTTLVDCTFSDNVAELDGGGMFNSFSNPTLTGCSFTGNSAYFGGAIANDNSDAQITDCTFLDNIANLNGGGIDNVASNPTVLSCTIAGSLAGNDGGGMMNFDGSNPTIIGCRFVGNSTGNGSGGAMFNDQSSPSVVNCAFSGNSAANADGGAILNWNNSDPAMRDCSFSGNSAGSDGGAVANFATSSPTLSNCILWGNSDSGGTDESAQIHTDSGSPVVTYSCIQGLDTYAGNGNIGDDPLFLREPDDGWGIGDNDDYGDLRLGFGSPCIDAADNIAVPADELDLDGDEDTSEHIPFDLAGRFRFVDDPMTPDTGQADPAYPDLPIVDMGAHEYALPIYVDADATGANDGSSWADAYVHLQDALTEGESLGVPTDIWVAAGIYRPDRDTENPAGTGDRAATFGLLDGVALYGGFAGTETSLDERDIEANETILSGDLDGDDVEVSDPADLLDEPTRAENSYHVVTGSWTVATAVVDGFTITGGNSNDVFYPNNTGAGMFTDTGDPLLANCTFTANAAATYGGGMNNYDSISTLANCTFSANFAWIGAGLRNCASAPTLLECVFSGNATDDDGNGGGMANECSSSPMLVDCTFTANSAGFGGGMKNWDNSSPSLLNCEFTGNQATGWGGGGLHNEETSSPTLTNCTFTANLAPSGSAGGMANWENSNPGLTDCTFTENSASNGGAMYNAASSPTITNCAFTGNFTSGDGGGMLNEDASATLTNCIFTGNQAGTDGGALANTSCNAELTNCIFVGNQAGDDGGAISNWACYPIVTNCTIVENVAQNDGGGLEAAGESLPSVTNCVLWGNSDGGGGDESAQLHHDGISDYAVSYSLIEGLSEYVGSGNIDGDPLFLRDPDDGDDGWGIGDNDDYGDLRLGFGSPCIDAADNIAVPADDLDLDGDEDTSEHIPFDLAGRARFVDDPMTPDTGQADPAYPDLPIVDMGAHEYWPDCNGNGVTDDQDIADGTSEDCNDNAIPDECDIAGRRLDTFATGMTVPEDIVPSRGGYPAGFFVPDAEAAVVYNISADGNTVAEFSIGHQNPIGAVFAPDEFGGLGDRLFVANSNIDEPPETDIVFVESDGTVVPFAELSMDGISGLAYIPLSIGGPAAGRLLATAQRNTGGTLQGSIHAIDATGEVRTLISSAGAQIFTPALAPSDFGDFANLVFIGTVDSGDLYTFDLVSSDFSLFVTLPLDEGQVGLRQIAFSPTGWFGPIDPALADEPVMVVAISASQLGGGGAAGSIVVLDQRGDIVDALTPGDAGMAFDPRGLRFVGSDLLISNAANGTLVWATLQDFRGYDCNANSVPDDCDIADGTSEDCNSNGVPDECEMPGDTTLAVWVGDAGPWGISANWCPQVVPHNAGGMEYQVIIDGPGSIVELDISPTVDAITLTGGAKVEITSGGSQVLTVTGAGTLTNEGTLQAAGGSVLTFLADLGRTVTNAGTIQAVGGSTLNLTANVTQGGPGLIGASGPGATLNITDGSTVTDGDLAVADEALIVLDASTALSVSLTGTGGGNIQVQNGGTLVDPTIEVLEVPNAHVGLVEGVVTNEGIISINATDDLTGLRPTTQADVLELASSTGGELALFEEPAAPSSHTILGDPFTPLINHQDHLIHGVGWIDATTVTNFGEIRAEDFGDRTLNIFAFEIDNQGTITVKDGADLDAIGNLTVESAGSGLLVDGDALVTLFGGSLTLTEEGAYAAVAAPSGPLTAYLITDGVWITGETSGGQMLLSDLMEVEVDGGTVIDGSALPCRRGDRGCLPPILSLANSAHFEGSSIEVLGGGAVEMGGNAAIEVFGPVVIDSGGVLRSVEALEATLVADSVEVLSNQTGGIMELGAGAAATIDADFSIHGCGGRSRGCLPPILSLAGSAHVNAGGTFWMSGVVEVQVEASATFELAGDFANESTDPFLFHWDNGPLTMNGQESEQSFELAGEDRGPDLSGFIDNFALGTLRIEPGTTVDFFDVFDNVEGEECEVLYVTTLSLGAGATVRLHGCNVYFGDLIDEGATIDDSEGGALVCVNPGDINCDGVVDLDDITLFVEILLGLDDYPPHIAASDLNGDGTPNGDDIQPFVDVLVAG